MSGGARLWTGVSHVKGGGRLLLLLRVFIEEEGGWRGRGPGGPGGEGEHGEGRVRDQHTVLGDRGEGRVKGRLEGQDGLLHQTNI